MKNLLIRTVTGAAFVIVVIGSSLWNYWAFVTVFGVFTIFGIWEFYLLLNQKGIKSNRIFGILITITFYIITALSTAKVIDKYAAIFYSIAFAVSFIIFFTELFRKSDNPFLNIASTFLGIIYLAVPFSLLIVMSDFGAGMFGLFTFPIIYFFMIWINDIFAYLAGIAIGRHRLFERVSPKKSWEGAIGGLIFTIILAIILSHFYEILSLVEWLGLAVIIVVFGNFGDLTESMLKRSVGCKDSGKFFPGHGGILDRFDSMLLSAPFVFVYMEIILLIK